MANGSAPAQAADQLRQVFPTMTRADQDTLLALLGRHLPKRHVRQLVGLTWHPVSQRYDALHLAETDPHLAETDPTEQGGLRSTPLPPSLDAGTLPTRPLASQPPTPAPRAGDGYASVECALWDRGGRLVAHASQVMYLVFPDGPPTGTARLPSDLR